MKIYEREECNDDDNEEHQSRESDVSSSSCSSIDDTNDDDDNTIFIGDFNSSLQLRDDNLICVTSDEQSDHSESHRGIIELDELSKDSSSNKTASLSCSYDAFLEFLNTPSRQQETSAPKSCNDNIITNSSSNEDTILVVSSSNKDITSPPLKHQHNQPRQQKHRRTMSTSYDNSFTKSFNTFCCDDDQHQVVEITLPEETNTAATTTTCHQHRHQGRKSNRSLIARFVPGYKKKTGLFQ